MRTGDSSTQRLCTARSVAAGIRRIGGLRRPRGALLEWGFQARKRLFAPALQLPIPADHLEAHRSGRAPRSRSQQLALLRRSLRRQRNDLRIAEELLDAAELVPQSGDGWLEYAGARVLRRSDGSVPFGIEISPLYALDAAELRSKLDGELVVEGPIYQR